MHSTEQTDQSRPTVFRKSWASPNNGKNVILQKYGKEGGRGGTRDCDNSSFISKKKAQARNELSNMLPKSSHLRKKPPPLLALPRPLFSKWWEPRTQKLKSSLLRIRRSQKLPLLSPVEVRVWLLCVSYIDRNSARLFNLYLPGLFNFIFPNPLKLR